mmetsp:Transcript_56222/g.97653  ORF Transcript_56222/g.97653 Transcript_56222/m.97653 type:complete len:596 (-) Transcript_56222:63-1850(-)
MVTTNDRIDRARLRRDPEYLAHAVCEKFKQVDTYHRGLITAAAFQRALDELDLRCGQKEVDRVLQFCVITDDGYVHYKELMQYLAPEQPRAKQSSAKGTIFPEDRPKSRSGKMDDAASRQNSKVSSSNQRSTFIAERMEDLQHAYARWDRGQLSNEGFKVEIRGLGLSIPKELERLLVMHDMSRNMTFGQLMSAMQIDENDGRRARSHYPQSETDTSAGYSAPSEDPRYAARPRSEPSSWSSVTNGDNSALRQAICDFVDGNIPAPAFRRQLHQCGVTVTPELARLITRHENANCVKFQEFTRHILRQDRQELINSESATPSYPATPGDNSVPHTPPYRMAVESLPYAVGGDWAPTGRSARGPPSDAGSYISRGEASRGSRGGAGGSYAGGYPQQHSRAPYATEGSPGLSHHGGLSPDSMRDVPVFRPDVLGRPPSTPGNMSRGSGRHVRDDVEASEAGSQRTPRQYSAMGGGGSSGSQRARTPIRGQEAAASAYAGNNMADCLQWPTARPPEQQERPGKRFYGARDPADCIVPQGGPIHHYEGYRDSGFRDDLEKRLAPYGTERDMAHQRPEHAGTYEYQPAADRRGGHRGHHR